MNPTGNPSQMTIQNLRIFIGRQIGLPTSYNGTYSETMALAPNDFQMLTRGMVNYIVANPGRFTDSQVATARAEVGRANNNQMLDTDFSFSDFGNEVANNANELIGKPLQSIGQGVSASVNLVGYLIPLGVLAAIVIFAWPYVKKAQQ